MPSVMRMADRFSAVSAHELPAILTGEFEGLSSCPVLWSVEDSLIVSICPCRITVCKCHVETEQPLINENYREALAAFMSVLRMI